MSADKKTYDEHHGKAGAFIVRNGKRVPDERAVVTRVEPLPTAAQPAPAAPAPIPAAKPAKADKPADKTPE